jgi:hypothetical protein
MHLQIMFFQGDNKFYKQMQSVGFVKKKCLAVEYTTHFYSIFQFIVDRLLSPVFDDTIINNLRVHFWKSTRVAVMYSYLVISA